MTTFTLSDTQLACVVFCVLFAALLAGLVLCCDRDGNLKAR